jgi:peptide/nickel transport system substrate-binding protein
LILPAAQQFLDPTFASSTLTTNTSQASQILASAGYKAGSDGIMVGPDGKKLSFTGEGISGYTDWDTDYQIITQDLKQIGIQLNVTDHDPSTAFADLQSGNFDMAIYYGTPGPTPYYIYDQVLASSNTAPIGQTATSNYERWSDPATDALLNQYISTTDVAQQKQAMYGIENIVVQQLPVIFLVNEPWWYEYNTVKYSGWPDKSNPYAEGSPFAYPDDEIVLLNLHQ